jgi:ABC-type lipoprotein export system ATPase subunit
VVVTHDPRLANRMDGVLELDAGRLRLVSTDRGDPLVAAARPVATPDR